MLCQPFRSDVLFASWRNSSRRGHQKRIRKYRQEGKLRLPTKLSCIYRWRNRMMVWAMMSTHHRSLKMKVLPRSYACGWMLWRRSVKQKNNEWLNWSPTTLSKVASKFWKKRNEWSINWPASLRHRPTQTKNFCNRKSRQKIRDQAINWLIKESMLK